MGIIRETDERQMQSLKDVLGYGSWNNNIVGSKLINIKHGIHKTQDKVAILNDPWPVNVSQLKLVQG